MLKVSLKAPLKKLFARPCAGPDPFHVARPCFGDEAKVRVHARVQRCDAESLVGAAAPLSPALARSPALSLRKGARSRRVHSGCVIRGGIAAGCSHQRMILLINCDSWNSAGPWRISE